MGSGQEWAADYIDTSGESLEYKPQPERMPCIYLAGAYSADNIAGVIANIHRGLEACIALEDAGFAVYCPWEDFLRHLMRRQTIDVAAAKARSLAWLERSDVVVVVPEGAAESKGTQVEIARACKLKIPVLQDGSIRESIIKLKACFGLGLPLESLQHAPQ